MARQVKNPVTGWWENLPDPRWVTPIHAVFYALMIFTGLSALGVTPRFLEIGLGDILLSFWAGLLIVGGSIGIPAVLGGWNIVERFSVLMIGLAVILYIATIVSLQTVVGQNLAWRVTMDAGLICHLLIRWIRVKNGIRDPERYSTYRPRAER